MKKEKSELQYWENKNWEKILIKDMSSDYIASCIRLIQRKNRRREYEQPLMNELKRRWDEKNYLFPVIQSWEIERTPEQQERDEWFWSQD
jgi:hypothetical protein